MPAILLILSFFVAAAQPADSLHDGSAGRLTGSAFEADEILWLARCIYSESDRAHEQRLVAWVVRNRVETRYRGDTYRDVVLEDRQFSAFNEPTPRRDRIVELTAQDKQPAWQQALQIAREVYHARPSSRPFSVTTRHFYSPVSMRNRAIPHWAVNETPITLAGHDIDPDRFRFFDGIDEGGADDGSVSNPIRTHHEAVVGQMRRARRTLRTSGRVARPVPPIEPSRSR